MKRSSKWAPTPSFMKYLYHSDGRLLCMVVGQRPSPDRRSPWLAIALEAPNLASGQDVLDNHGHKAIGSYPSKREALRSANSFGRAWLRDFKATRVATCACDELEEPGDTIES